MRSNIFCLLLWAIVCTTWALPDFAFPTQPKPLHEVFQPDLRSDYKRHPSSCSKPLVRDNGNHGGHYIGMKMYDRSRAYEDREENVLNNVWWQTNTMIKYARAALWSGIPGEWYHIRQMNSLAFAFFGIYPREDGPDFEPEDENLLTLNKLRDRYRRVLEGLEHAQPNGPRKPKLFCDGGYWTQQNADSPAKDKNGKTIRTADGSAITLAEWEQTYGRNFQHFWYFWFDVDYDTGNEKGYLVLGRDRAPAISPTEQYPFPKGANGQPNPCVDGIYAEVMQAVHPGSDSGAEAWHIGDHIILCPSSFASQKFPNTENDIDRMGKQREHTDTEDGTLLDAMGVVGGNLAHERILEDYYPWYPKREGDKYQGTVHADFPLSKSGWSQARVKGFYAVGAMASMSIAMHEIAEPMTPIDEIISITFPKTMMWFARTAWLTMVGGQNWRRGRCHAWADDDPFMVPNTEIPEPPWDRTKRQVLGTMLESNISNISAVDYPLVAGPALIAPVA